MEEGAASTEPAPRSILLHVVSPSAEAQRLTFSDIPVTTTIGEVKLKIQETVASKPGPELQRLIYQGKPLIRPEVTLETILTKEAIESFREFTLHLVLPPTNAGSSSAHSSAPPLRSTTTHSSSNGLGNSDTRNRHQDGTRHTNSNTQQYQFPTPAVSGANQPNAVPRIQAHQTINYPLNPPPGANFQHQHNNPQFQNNGGLGGLTGIGNTTQGLPHDISRQIQQAIHGAQQHINQEINRDRRAHQADPNDSSTDQGTGQQHSTQNTQPVARSQSQTPTHSTVIREGQMPGGQWRVVVNQTTVPIGSHANPQMNQQGGASHQGGQQTAPQSGNTIQPPNSVIFPNFQPPTGPPGQAHNHGNPTEMFNRMYQSISNINTGLNRLAGQFVTLNQPLLGQQAQSASFPTTVYLLTSPNGYQALLTSPSGTYSSPNFSMAPHLNGNRNNFPRPHLPMYRPTPTFNPQNINAQQAEQVGAQPAQQHQEAAAAPAPAPIEPENANANAILPPARVQPADVAQAPPQMRNEAADVLRIVLNLGGNIWVAVRLLGFIWLATHGSSWLRTLAFGFGAILIYVAQTGALARPMRAVFDPLRRHLEGLLAEDPMADGMDLGPLDAAARPGATGRMPTPEELSARLLRERRERDMGALRRTFRRAERAIVLFAASLVPGVGELHVRARERQRERFEAARRLLEERIREQTQAQEAEAEAEGQGEQEEQNQEGAIDENQGEAGEDQPIRGQENHPEGLRMRAPAGAGGDGVD